MFSSLDGWTPCNSISPLVPKRGQVVRCYHHWVVIDRVAIEDIL
jgi:hypothetical protein